MSRKKESTKPSELDRFLHSLVSKNVKYTSSTKDGFTTVDIEAYNMRLRFNPEGAFLEGGFLMTTTQKRT